TFHNSRIEYRKADNTPELAVDDDALCALDARVRYEPKMILVRRLSAQGSADLEPSSDSTPRCNLPYGDKRRVEIALSHLRVLMPEKKNELPRVDGHARVRAPVGIAERAADLPETDGWVAFEGDVRYTEEALLPEVSAHFEAHDLKLDQ